MPHARQHETSTTSSPQDAGKTGYWGNMRDYIVSLLKAWWGDAATEDNDYCFDYLPRLTGHHGTYDTVVNQIEGRCKGYFVVGENPAVGSANGKMQRLGLANLDWLVVRDMAMIETATFWKDGPEIDTGELVTEEIGTEVFFLPAASHVEKEGTFTNTQRMLQWRDKAVEPPGDARSDLQFYYDLGRRIREKLAGSTDEMDRPLLDLTWDYPTEGPLDEPERRGGAPRDQRHRARTARPCPPTPSSRATAPPAAAAGSTAGSTPTRSTRRRGASRTGSRASSHPSGAGSGRPTAGSSTTAPRPTPTAALERAQASTSGGTPSRVVDR